MPPARLPFLIAAVTLPTLAAPAQQRVSPRGGQTTMISIIVQQRMVIRVPRLSPQLAPASVTRSAVTWTEKKADKCVPLIDIAAASIGGDSVDLILNGGKRLRAKLGSDCRALDFYSGFYVKMTPDGKACASRDAFRTRSGGECRIKAFRTLVAKR